MEKIAFVIAALNEERNIGNCIDLINQNTYKNKEIIVVDGGSKDKTVEIAKKKGAIVLEESGENRCPSNAWNQAIKYTNAELICLLGSDFLLSDKEFAEKAADAFKDPKVGCVYTNVMTDEETLIEKIVSCYGMSMHPNVFRRSIVLKIGGLPTIGFGEDRILSIRFLKYMKANGMYAKYLQNTYYSGHGVQTVRALYKQGKWYGRTAIIYLKEFYKESSFLETLREMIGVNFKMAYFLLLIISAISFGTSRFYYFFAPFAAITLFIIIKNIPRPYHTLKVFTNIISGFGFTVGFLSYVLGTNKTRGRG